MHVVQINPLVDQGAAEGFAAGEMYEAQIEFARSKVERILSAMSPEVEWEIIIEIGESRNSINRCTGKAWHGSGGDGHSWKKGS